MAQKFSGSAQGQRQLRVGEQIRHKLPRIFQNSHLNDPELQDLHRVTVSEVRISPDLKNASVFVMVLGGGSEMPTLLDALNRASSYFRTELSRQMDMRYTPRLRFLPDETYENADHINSILNIDRVKKDTNDDDDTEN